MVREFIRGIFALAFGLVLFFVVIQHPSLIVQLLDLLVNTAYNIANQIGDNIHVR